MKHIETKNEEPDNWGHDSHSSMSDPCACSSSSFSALRSGVLTVDCKLKKILGNEKRHALESVKHRDAINTVI